MSELRLFERGLCKSCGCSKHVDEFGDRVCWCDACWDSWWLYSCADAEVAVQAEAMVKGKDIALDYHGDGLSVSCGSPGTAWSWSSSCKVAVLSKEGDSGVYTGAEVVAAACRAGDCPEARASDGMGAVVAGGELEFDGLF